MSAIANFIPASAPRLYDMTSSWYQSMQFHLSSPKSLASLALAILGVSEIVSIHPRCRNLPGSLGFPNASEWAVLNASIGGALIPVIPSAKFCHSLPTGNCTEEEWLSTTFRSGIPGAMDQVNWEQDYLSHPPSLCLQNGTACGQGDVPVFAINATSAEQIQAGVAFANKHNLKVAVKASGHDYLGRSTAKGSLLFWTHHLRNISFTESFVVGSEDVGSAVTVGSGMPFNKMYAVAKENRKYLLSGNTATVVAAGGYVQGAGHSALSPAFGLAADNSLQFTVVIANGSLVTANEVENTDLFWALRGGGAGSWGVVISATFRTFPIFNATIFTTVTLAPTNASSGALAELHARHIFDLDETRAGQYFYFYAAGPDVGNVLVTYSYFVHATPDEAASAVAPFLQDAVKAGFSVLGTGNATGLVNDLVIMADVQAGKNVILGSRLVPADAYRSDACISKMGEAYTELFEQGAIMILGHLVAGGKVSVNANIRSAVHPKWRTAKTHIVVPDTWSDSATLAEITSVKDRMRDVWVPLLSSMTGESDPGAYSNEADVREPDFKTTFFGTNYSRLKKIKDAYDPAGLFIVGAGVGSDEWDENGICRLK